jgi:hypothetical protein
MTRRLPLAWIAGAGLSLAACQHDVHTMFPPGLEPFEDNPVPEQTPGMYTETLMTSSTDTDYIRVYGRGYVLVSPATLWPLAKAPAPNIAVCSTNQQMITPDNDPSYEYSFLVHYIVNNVLTVEWDDQWRFGTVEGTVAAPTLAMIKHQKTQGSSFIKRSEGTIQLTATDDPNVTELAFVEHLDAVGGGVADVVKGTQHNFDSLVAVAHGNPIPACP